MAINVDDCACHSPRLGFSVRMLFPLSIDVRGYAQDADYPDQYEQLVDD